jgi:hypothetical protein
MGRHGSDEHNAHRPVRQRRSGCPQRHPSGRRYRDVYRSGAIRADAVGNRPCRIRFLRQATSAHLLTSPQNPGTSPASFGVITSQINYPAGLEVYFLMAAWLYSCSPRRKSNSSRDCYLRRSGSDLAGLHGPPVWKCSVATREAIAISKYSDDVETPFSVQQRFTDLRQLNFNRRSRRRTAARQIALGNRLFQKVFISKRPQLRF